MTLPPAIALIIPSYNSFRTIEQSLNSFCKQDYALYEIIVVDSSPNNLVKQIVTNHFPQIKFIHSKERLLPHAARNVGVKNTSSELLIFTDPDIYAPPNWIKCLVESYQQHGGVSIGSLMNHTNSWLDWGIHLGKFDSFLPEPATRPIGFCATANMLCSRADFEKVGGFENDEMLGDLLISWKFTENNIPIFLAPQAVAAHHHTQTYFNFLHERYVRGADFGRLRRAEFHWTKFNTFKHILMIVVGIRFASLIIRETIHAWKAKLLLKFLYTMPISLSGQVSWLWGEMNAYLRQRND